MAVRNPGPSTRNSACLLINRGIMWSDSVEAVVVLYVLAGLGGYSLFFLKRGFTVGRYSCKGLLGRVDIPPLVRASADRDAVAGLPGGQRAAPCDVQLGLSVAALHPKPLPVCNIDALRLGVESGKPEELEGTSVSAYLRPTTV